MEKISFGVRAVIFKEGTIANRLYLIKAGEVLCLKNHKDRLIPVFLAKEGDIIGEAAMIDNLNYTYSAISMGATELIEVTAFSFKQVFSKAPEWILNLTTSMIERLMNTSNLIVENRIIHSSVISDDFYTPQLENELKKLIV
jgi:CRP-like cAMP-binding protein